MDPTSYLRKYGWKPGLGLHGTKGIQKPILVAHKTDLLGLGNKKHNHADAWWERAFDSSLKTLTVDASGGAGDVTVKQTNQSGVLAMLVAKGVAQDLSWEGQQSPLYRYFVKGTLLEGTFVDDETDGTGPESSGEATKIEEIKGDAAAAEYKSKKRKRRDDDDEPSDRKERKERSESKDKSKKQSKDKLKDRSKDKKKRKKDKSKDVASLLLGAEVEALKEKAPSDSGIEILSEVDENVEIAKREEKKERDKKKRKDKEASEGKKKSKDKKEKRDKKDNKRSDKSSKDKERSQRKKSKSQ